MSELTDPDVATPYTDPIATLRAALRGRYEIERQIGQGAFATVYLARDLKHERKVAIKVLNADPESETGEIRFIREIRVVARLQHPNILPLHDSGHVEAMLYYVMPYVVGETLRIRMHRERQMGVDAAVGIARETADALAYAHSQGVIHRDIKPENILLSGSHAIVADFGIARAIDVGGVRQLTMTGVAGPGTPAYMSPEQLLGDRVVDARSDIYSLGCVLYEMLAGKPPFPGKDGFVKRFTEPPPHISSLRRDAPPWLDSVVGQSLAKDPDDRYLTAGDFVAALAQPPSMRAPRREQISKHALASPPMFASDPLEAQEFATAFPNSYPSGEPQPAEDGAHYYTESPSRHRWPKAIRAHPARAGISVLALLAIAATLAAASRSGSLPAVFGAATKVDSARYAIFAAPASESGLQNIGAHVADSLYDAFTKWTGLSIVPDTRVEQAIADGAPAPSSEAAAVSLARVLGAGRAVWIRTSGTTDLPRMRVYLLDSQSAQNLDEFAVPVSGRGEEYFAGATRRLLGFGNRPASAAGCDGLTKSFRAWSACSRGHASLAAWNLPAAEHNFREAVNADPSYAPSRLWLAQVLAWKGPVRRGESYELVRAAAESRKLHQRDHLTATGLTALLENRFPAACAAYAELTRMDSLDFVGWYGLGECQSFDSAVVRSASSPSKWVFRSSIHSAVNAYMRALRIQPGVYEIFQASKLQSLMPVSTTVTRWGRGGATGNEVFLAFPTLEPGDTIGFVPYPDESFWLVPHGASASAALRRNKALLSEFTENWAKRFPRSWRAQEALANAFEAREELGEGPSRASAALRAIDSASALMTASKSNGEGSADLVGLRARKVRVHFKRGEFNAARILADSILRAPSMAANDDDLQWIAALTGRADLAAHFWQRSLSSNSVTGGTVHPSVAVPASKYFTYAALGICDPQLSAARARLESALGDYITRDIRDSVRLDLAARSDFLATPCTNGKSLRGKEAQEGDNLGMAQSAFARGDTAKARRLLAAFADQLKGLRPGDMSADYVFQDAWLRTQVGDTTGAATSLDAALGALPTFGAAAFADLAGAASFARAMVLRSEIAAKRGDSRTARRWAAAVNELWASADPPLRGVAAQLLRTVGPDSRLR